MYIGIIVWYRISYKDIYEIDGLVPGNSSHISDVQLGELFPAQVVRIHRNTNPEKASTFSGIADLNVSVPVIGTLWRPGVLMDADPVEYIETPMGLTRLPEQGKFTVISPAPLYYS